MSSVTVKNLADMKRFARDFVATLQGGEVIGLVGDLGAGKTTFVQMLSAALGVKKPVRSPTFILMQVFDTRVRKGTRVRRICHVDAYRLKNETELFAIGFEEYAGQPDVVALVEWADRVPLIRQLPNYKEIRFGFGGGDERVLQIT